MKLQIQISFFFLVAFRDTPRKRSAAVGGSVCPGRTGPTANSTNTEQPQPEEVVDGNFPVSSNLCRRAIVLRSSH